MLPETWAIEGDRVIVKPDMMEERMGSIYIPETAREDRRNMGNTGTLMAIGPAASLCRIVDGKAVEITNDMLPMRCVHARYGGMMFDGPEYEDDRGIKRSEKFRIMRDDDIAMFIDEEA